MININVFNKRDKNNYMSVYKEGITYDNRVQLGTVVIVTGGYAPRGLYRKKVFLFNLC